MDSDSDVPAPLPAAAKCRRKISTSEALVNGVLRRISKGAPFDSTTHGNRHGHPRLIAGGPSLPSEEIHLGFTNHAYSISESGGSESDSFGPLPQFLPMEQSDERSRKISYGVGYDISEAIPQASNYEQLNGAGGRPTLDELIHGKKDPDSVVPVPQGLRRGTLGWINGVLIFSILNLWGVMLFLRMSWMTAQAGMGLFLVIVLIGTIIAVLTSLSTSAISTNGLIGTGGTYYMISRSLGPEFGTAIGIIFTLANTVNVSLNLQGFAETVVVLLEENGFYMVDKANDMRIIGVLALIALTIFTFCGMELITKLQLVFFVILLAAILNIFIGSFIPPTLQEEANGLVGYSSQNFIANFYPSFQKGESFMSVFGVFFPSVTGILAGTSITGDLKDPSGAIPKGTIIAILFTSSTYVLVGWVSVAVTLPHASGNISDLLDGNLTACVATAAGCPMGSINDYYIMQVVSHFRWIIVAGIFAATLSTSLGCIVFAPKIFQALCRDKILPGIHVFAHGYGKGDEPYRAYGLGTIIAVAFLMPSDLNFISAIVSNFFLLTYALVNYATFNASYSKSPGWRPTFRYYNKWLSLLTGIACVVIMFCLHYTSAIITIGIITVVFGIVYYRKPTTNWGTSTQANIFRSALNDALRLLKVEDHVKNFRPQILALTGLPCVRPALVHFAYSIARETGMLICGHVLIGETVAEKRTVAQETYKWLRRTRVRAFYDSITANNLADGANSLIQTSGLGKMKPNIILMGYHRGWKIATERANEEYVSIIGAAFESHLSVMILYAHEGFDITGAVDFDELVANNALTRVDTIDDDLSLKAFQRLETMPVEILRDVKSPAMLARLELAKSFQSAKRERKVAINVDQPTKKNSDWREIHVWWLYDDGGLSLLVPYLLTRTSPWKGSKLRIFCLANKPKEGEVQEVADAARQNMRLLLDKFRIQADEVTPVDFDTPPSETSIRWFNDLITRHRDKKIKSNTHNGPGIIPDFDLQDLQEKTLKHIRLRELLNQYSSKASLNVVTMPLPKQNRSSTLYMANLEIIVAGMPTTLLIRGAHENVLTYYC